MTKEKRDPNLFIFLTENPHENAKKGQVYDVDGGLCQKTKLERTLIAQPMHHYDDNNEAIYAAEVNNSFWKRPYKPC